MAITYTLADHIYKDRVLFQIPKSKFHVSEENKFDEFYYYDDEGRARVQFTCYYSGFSSFYGYDVYLRDLHFLKYSSSGNYEKWLSFSSGGSGNDGDYKNSLIIETKVNKETEYLEFYINGVKVCDVSKKDIYANFGGVSVKPKPPNIEGDDIEDIVPPSDDFTDNPPQIWGYTTEDIEDITGHTNTPIPITFRAWDDIGISRFYYCLINESEIEGTDLIRPVNPTKYGEFTYRFNILKSTEGNYKYKIIAFDTSNQRTDSNIFNVTVEPPITPPSSTPTPPSVSDSDYVILYDKKSNDFTNNGIGILNNDIVECVVENEENGIYELTLKYLITGKYVDELLDTENIIKCKTDISNSIAQLFRIYDTEYIMEENIIIVKANHISYDLKDSFVESVNLVDVTCKQATQTLISKAVGNDKFVVDSDIESIANFKHERVSVLEAIMGIEDSIFDTYGNDKLVINRNNFNYSINKQVDNDKGIIIAYSKNLLGFRRSINTNDIVTGIYPYAYSRTGACVKLKERVLYSENATEYATYKIKAIDFTSPTINDEESLRNACKDYFNNGCNFPKISYDIDFVMLYLSNYSLKNQFRSLEEVVLGDVITIQDSKIGLNVKARVIKTTYNVLKNKYEKIQLGNFKNEYRTSKKNERSNFKKIVRSIIN